MWIAGHYAMPLVTHTLTKESEDFHRGGNHSKHMPPLTCQYCKSCTCDENFDKKYRAAAKLISNHEKHKAAATLISSHNLQNNCSLKKCISEHKCSSKLLPEKMHFKNMGAHQNCSLKKYISNHKRTSKMHPQKIHFKTFVIKKIFTDMHKNFCIIIRVYARWLCVFFLCLKCPKRLISS